MGYHDCWVLFEGDTVVPIEANVALTFKGVKIAQATVLRGLVTDQPLMSLVGRLADFEMVAKMMSLAQKVGPCVRCIQYWRDLLDE